MNVFITGGAGFIGSHLVEYFLANGDSVTALDNFSTGNALNLKNSGLNAISGDIRNQELVEKLTNESDLVLHMAAALGVSNIMNKTLDSISTNIAGSEVVLNAATKFDKRIIIASTSEIYGKNPKQPLSENDDRVIGNPQKIRWSYSDAKAIEEAIATSLYLDKKLKVTTVRFFNTVGPRQTGQYGMVVPRFVQAAIKGEDLLVHGDGSQTRVFCHIEDAVAGLVSLTRDENTFGEVYNIGGVGETSILTLAKKVIERTQSKSNIRFIPYSDVYPTGFEDMQRRVPDTSKIRAQTGWKASKTLDDIIDNVRDYFISVGD
jgi:UDP-glucose 4-epimerase